MTDDEERHDVFESMTVRGSADGEADEEVYASACYERPERFTRRYGFVQYRAAWQPVGDGEQLVIRQRECRHTFGRGYEAHGSARRMFRGTESEVRQVHELLGIMLGIRDPLDVEPPGSPDDRSIEDISAIEECEICETAPAAIVCVEREADGTTWTCYNCGAMI